MREYTHVWNSPVPFTTAPLGLDPAMRMFLHKRNSNISFRITKERLRVDVYPLGVKVVVEWYSRAILVVGMTLLLILWPRGNCGLYKDGVKL